MRFPRLAAGIATSAVVVLAAVPAGAATYQVRSGDSLSVIARRHGVAIDALAAANGIRDLNRIREGQVLVIPGTATPAAPSTAAPSASGATYQVRSGDTLGAIARRFGQRLDALAAANGISDPHRIRVGQVLQVGGRNPTPPTAASPTPAAPPTPAAAPSTTYVVRSGDVLSTIARRLGTTTFELVRLNGLADPDRLRIGQVLTVPATGQAAPSAPPAPTAAPASPPGAVNRYGNLPARLLASTERMALVPAFERWSAVYGVPVELTMAVAWYESGWQIGATSNKGAIGIGQIMPATAAWLASDIIGEPGLDPRDPDDNIRMTAAFLGWLHGQMGSRDLAIAAYYQGPTSIRRNGLFRVTETYLAGVTGLLPAFTAA